MSGEAKRQAAQAADAAESAIALTNWVIQGRANQELVIMSADEGARRVREGLDRISESIRASEKANHDIIEDAQELVDILGRLGDEAAPVLEQVQMAVLFTGSLGDQVISNVESASELAEGMSERITSLAGSLAMLGDVANGSQANLIHGAALTRELERDL